MRRVLITGIAGPLAGRLAASLETRDDVGSIVGVDVRDPGVTLGRTRFVRAELDNPLVAKVLVDERIDTVVHAWTATSSRAVGGRARMKERNVIATMQLLAACQRAPDLDRFVLRSTTAVYGSDHTDPAAFREDAAPAGRPARGYGKDAIEIEAYVRAFERRRRDVDVSIVRFANLLGGTVDGAFTALVSLRLVPTVLGFDPRLQFCHEDDAVAVLERVIDGGPAGTYNAAGDGVLYLSQCIRLAQGVQVPVPGPLVSAVAELVRRSGKADVPPDQLRFLRFGRVVDTTRLREQLGVTPRYTSRQAFEDMVARRRPRLAG